MSYPRRTRKYPEDPFEFLTFDAFGNECWEVETIIDRKFHRSSRSFHYLVKWKGWSIEESTWEPIENLIGSEEMLAEFEKNYQEVVLPLVEGSYSVSGLPSKPLDFKNCAAQKKTRTKSKASKLSKNKPPKHSERKKPVESDEESGDCEQNIKNSKLKKPINVKLKLDLWKNGPKILKPQNDKRKLLEEHSESEQEKMALDGEEEENSEEILSPEIRIEPFQLEETLENNNDPMDNARVSPLKAIERADSEKIESPQIRIEDFGFEEEILDNDDRRKEEKNMASNEAEDDNPFKDVEINITNTPPTAHEIEPTAEPKTCEPRVENKPFNGSQRVEPEKIDLIEESTRSKVLILTPHASDYDQEPSTRPNMICDERLNVNNCKSPFRKENHQIVNKEGYPFQKTTPKDFRNFLGDASSTSGLNLMQSLRDQKQPRENDLNQENSFRTNLHQHQEEHKEPPQVSSTVNMFNTRMNPMTFDRDKAIRFFRNNMGANVMGNFPQGIQNFVATNPNNYQVFNQFGSPACFAMAGPVWPCPPNFTPNLFNRPTYNVVNYPPKVAGHMQYPNVIQLNIPTNEIMKKLNQPPGPSPIQEESYNRYYKEVVQKFVRDRKPLKFRDVDWVDLMGWARKNKLVFDAVTEVIKLKEALENEISREAKEIKETKERKEPKEPKETKETKVPKEVEKSLEKIVEKKTRKEKGERKKKKERETSEKKEKPKKERKKKNEKKELEREQERDKFREKEEKKKKVKKIVAYVMARASVKNEENQPNQEASGIQGNINIQSEENNDDKSLATEKDTQRKVLCITRQGSLKTREVRVKQEEILLKKEEAKSNYSFWVKREKKEEEKTFHSSFVKENEEPSFPTYIEVMSSDEEQDIIKIKKIEKIENDERMQNLYFSRPLPRDKLLHQKGMSRTGSVTSNSGDFHTQNEVCDPSSDPSKGYYTKLTRGYLKGRISSQEFLEKLCPEGNFKDDEIKDVEHITWNGTTDINTGNYFFKVSWKQRPDGTQKCPSIISWNDFKKNAPKEAVKYVTKHFLNFICKYGTFKEV